MIMAFPTHLTYFLSHVLGSTLCLSLSLSLRRLAFVAMINIFAIHARALSPMYCSVGSFTGIGTVEFRNRGWNEKFGVCTVWYGMVKIRRVYRGKGG